MTSFDELEKLKNTVTSAFGFECQVLKQSQTIPLDILLCVAPPDHKGRERSVNFCFLPFGETDTEEINLLQFYTVLAAIEAGTKESLEKLLLRINHRTSFGDFSINDDNDIALRYVYVVSKKDGVRAKEFTEAVSLFLFTLDMFSPKIESFIKNEISYEQLTKELE